MTDGNFTLKETGSGKWTVSYKQIGDAWYLADELSQGSVDDGTGTFEHVDVQFFNDTEVTEPPDSLR